MAVRPSLCGFSRLACLVGWIGVWAACYAAEPPATKEFEIRNDRAFLGGVEVTLWGLRCGNAFHSWTVTERHVRAMDNMTAHGLNCLGVYIQGSHGGWPDPNAGFNGFRRDGRLKPDVAKRLEWLTREADKRGMVVMVGLFSPRKDQEFYDEKAIHRAVEEAGRFLMERKLKNVFVDILHEFDHSERIDQEIFREPDGAAKKAKLTRWFKAVAPDIEVGVCPYEKSATADTYPGMEVRIIQKGMGIPSSGFVVNVETQKQDAYENDGVFNEGHRKHIFADCQRYLESPNAAMLFHAAFIQGIGNFSGTAPHAEMGGDGSSPSDRGVRFYYEWVRDHVGRWEYPRHVKQ
ncbi:MAG: hypothetical protein ACOX1P_21365 [Thermoguttaceae bacterium]